MDVAGPSSRDQTTNDLNVHHHIDRSEQQDADVVAASGVMENQSSSHNVSMQCAHFLTYTA